MRVRHMRQTLDETLKSVSMILSLLTSESRRWKSLYMEAMAVGVSPSAFRNVLRWLLRHRYVERPRRGLYRATERGRRLLEALPWRGMSCRRMRLDEYIEAG